MRFVVAFLLCAGSAAAQVALVPLVRNLDRPVQAVETSDGRLLVAQQNGLIVSVRNGAVEPQPFADLRPIVSCCKNDEGFLSIVLDPHFDANRRFFVQYVDRDENTAVARAVAGDPAATHVLFTVAQPADNRPNHNGGTLAFGPDGMLYVSIGDGGDAQQVTDRAQQLDLLLGKILRIDVGGDHYTVPPSNPFVDVAGARPEIWALGLRNPWRTSFDRDTGDFWIGDVGDRLWEEVNLQPASSAGGENYGWPLVEGSHCYQQCPTPALTPPVLEYDHANPRCSVTGGHRYRGRNLPQLRGQYLYGDFCSGELFAASFDEDDDSWTPRLLMRTGAMIVSIDQTLSGELLIVDYRGSVYALSAPPASRRRAVAH